MTPLIEKYINSEIIKIIANEKNFDTITFNEFIRYLDYILQDNEKYGFEEEDYETVTLASVSTYIDEFISQREKGFSVDWSKEYAYNKLYEPNQSPPAFAYHNVLKINPEEAEKDLRLYSELTNRDELFIKHFAFLIDIDVPNATPSVEEQSIEYSKIYKEEIENGKSELFADKYADLTAMHEYSKLRCYSEATEHEKAILAGYSESYAKVFAFDISEYIANHCSTYEESFNDELVNMERNRLEKLYEHLK